MFHLLLLLRRKDFFYEITLHEEFSFSRRLGAEVQLPKPNGNYFDRMLLLIFFLAESDSLLGHMRS